MLTLHGLIKILFSLVEVSGPQVKNNFIDSKLSVSALCRHEVFTAVICIVQVLEIKRRFLCTALPSGH